MGLQARVGWDNLFNLYANNREVDQELYAMNEMMMKS